jgi:hypothetical protein
VGVGVRLGVWVGVGVAADGAAFCKLSGVWVNVGVAVGVGVDVSCMGDFGRGVGDGAIPFNPDIILLILSNLPLTEIDTATWYEGGQA